MNRFFLLIVLPMLWISCVNHDTAEPVSVDLCSLSDLHASLDSIHMATSCSIKNGAIYVSVTGGVPPYNYYLNDEPETDGYFELLGPGIYRVQISDFNGCDTTVADISVPADGFQFEASFEPDARCLADDGSITIEVNEGNPPFQFRLDGGLFGDGNTFTGLSHGGHTVEVKDNDDCVISLNLNVPRGQTDVTWTNDIKPIMETYCAVSGCHNGVSRSNDFRKHSTVRFYAKSIRSKTQDRSMPFDGSLSQAQIDIIACWIDDGALFN
jgi:hypothetical protein